MQLDPYGIRRSLEPRNVLPQQAYKIDASPTLADDEILIEVSDLNIDSASFHQIRETQKDFIEGIKKYVQELVRERGKHHNPVTQSGGMLLGTVAKMGAAYPAAKWGVKVGDRVASMISLTLTPLQLEKINEVYLKQDRISVKGTAVLFSSSPLAHIPADIDERLCLAVLDVAGAPAHAAQIIRSGQTVVAIGGAGKSGLLSLYEGKKKGAKTVAIDYSEKALAIAKSFSFIDHVIQADARDAVDVWKKLNAQGLEGDVVFNVANVPETEIATLMATKEGGLAYFFSMATQFARVALGCEGIGKDIELRFGNGYATGHAELALNILRDSKELRQYFEKTYLT